MKKNFQPVVPQSARANVPSLPNAGMRLDDFSTPNERSEHLNESLASTIAEPPPPQERATPQSQPVRATKMIATPIDIGLRKTLRELRNGYEISEAFTIEIALKSYFDNRPLEEIAVELRERGGRLRRPKA
jgi:hypothetical protein